MALTVKLESRIPQFTLRAHELLGDAVMATALEVEAGAKQRAPVDTGALRNSIQARRTGELSAEIAVGVEYGIYQEFGTVHMPAQPYLTPALFEAVQGFEQAVARALDQG